MESFFSFLEKRVDDSSSLLCVGLDPHIPDLKEPSAASALDFCLTLVKQTAPYAAAFKPNAAAEIRDQIVNIRRDLTRDEYIKP